MKPEQEKYWLEAQAELDQLLGLPSAPESLEPGQLWTLFPADRSDKFEDNGVIVLILEISEEQIRVLPAGTNPKIRTFIEPVISGMSLETGDPDAAIVPALMCLTVLNAHAFKEARYVGRVRPEGMGIVNEAMQKFQSVQRRQELIHARENKNLDAEEMDRAVADGIFLDLPIGDAHTWDERNVELMRVLNSLTATGAPEGCETSTQGRELPVKTLSFGDFQSRRAALFQTGEETLAAAPSGLLNVMDVFKGQERTFYHHTSLESDRCDLEVLIQGRAIQLILHPKEKVNDLPEIMWLNSDQKLQMIEFKLEPGSNHWVACKKLRIPVKLKTGQEWISIVP